MPGPGQYGNPVLKENLGGKFNLSNPKSDVDWMVRVSLINQRKKPSFLLFLSVSFPPAAAYSTHNLPQVWRSNQLPAPGQYGNPGEKEGLNHRGGRFSASSCSNHSAFL